VTYKSKYEKEEQNLISIFILCFFIRTRHTGGQPPSTSRGAIKSFHPKRKGPRLPTKSNLHLVHLSRGGSIRLRRGGRKEGARNLQGATAPKLPAGERALLQKAAHVCVPAPQHMRALSLLSLRVPCWWPRCHSSSFRLLMLRSGGWRRISPPPATTLLPPKEPPCTRPAEPQVSAQHNPPPGAASPLCLGLCGGGCGCGGGAAKDLLHNPAVVPATERRHQLPF
jgi:hypothetical protein